MLPTHIIHIIETYVLADFAFDDLALLDLAALVVWTLRFRLPRNNSVCVYASCAETEAKAASRMIEDFMVDWRRDCCMLWMMRSVVHHEEGFKVELCVNTVEVMNMLCPTFQRTPPLALDRHALMFSCFRQNHIVMGSSYASV